MRELLQNQPNQQEIAGFKPDSNTTQKVDIPIVLRNARGRVVWKIPGNSPEENEQLGIRNIQALFLTRSPEFLELFHFGEDGKIVEGEREKAKRFILEKIGKVKQFNKCQV